MLREPFTENIAEPLPVMLAPASTCPASRMDTRPRGSGSHEPLLAGVRAERGGCLRAAALTARTTVARLAQPEDV